jgi:predicted nucleic acid-binding protein
MIVVADTSPPLHLARIGRLDLLPAVVGRVTVPRTVWSELVHSGTRLDVVAAIRAADWMDVVPDPAMRDLGLDRGETAAILLAEELHADALLIEERRGRAAAMARGLSVIGTLGIVAGAKRLGAIRQVAPVVTALQGDGFWLSDALVAEFLRGLGEGPP